jgi:hypothetical protein
MKKILIVLLFGVFVLHNISFASYTSDSFISLDDDEEDKEDFLSEVRDNLNSNNFSTARKYLEKFARINGRDSEYKEMASIINKREKLYFKRQEERRKQQEQERLEEERRLAQQQRIQNSSSSSGSKVSSLIIDAEAIGGHCVVEKFEVTPPSNVGHSRNYNTTYINDYGYGISGNYGFSASICNNRKYCTGSFYVSGTKKRVKVNIYSHNCSFYINEF